MYLNQTAGSDRGICQGDGHKPAMMGWEEVGESGFEVFEAGPTKNPPVTTEGPKACDY